TNSVGENADRVANQRELWCTAAPHRETHTDPGRGRGGTHRRPGERRTTQHGRGPAGGPWGEATLVPPPPREAPAALGELERFLHAEDSLPPLIRVGLAHAQFETIHPFLDGNGRIGRLLITFLLTEKQLLARPVLYLSHYFKRHRAEYYERLQAVRDNGAWVDWLAFFLRGVSEVSEEAAATAAGILRMREDCRARITDHLGRAAANGYRILERLFDHPVVAVATVRDWLDVTPAGANNLVNRLVSAGILREITGYTRNRRFRFDPYLRLFEDEQGVGYGG
nr:Fic family protein [Pseudomonadota bacterium]